MFKINMRAYSYEVVSLRGLSYLTRFFVSTDEIRCFLEKILIKLKKGFYDEVKNKNRRYYFIDETSIK